VADEEVGAPPSRGHADKTTQAERIAQVERWMAERRSQAFMYREAERLWDIGDRQVRKLIARVHARRQIEAQAQRPYEREDLAATMELVIAECLSKGDLETARKATVDLMRFCGFLNADSPPALPPGAGAPTLNIGQVMIDMRSLAPIDRQKRLAELYEKRRVAGLPVDVSNVSSAPRPQKELDTATVDEAGGVDADPELADADPDVDDPKWFAE
jgi:hypothetical protein